VDESNQRAAVGIQHDRRHPARPVASVSPCVIRTASDEDVSRLQQRLAASSMAKISPDRTNRLQF
jgi:hypothetical protein